MPSPAQTPLQQLPLPSMVEVWAYVNGVGCYQFATGYPNIFMETPSPAYPLVFLGLSPGPNSRRSGPREWSEVLDGCQADGLTDAGTRPHFSGKGKPIAIFRKGRIGKGGRCYTDFHFAAFDQRWHEKSPGMGPLSHDFQLDGMPKVHPFEGSYILDRYMELRGELRPNCLDFAWGPVMPFTESGLSSRRLIICPSLEGRRARVCDEYPEGLTKSIVVKNIADRLAVLYPAV